VASVASLAGFCSHALVPGSSAGSGLRPSGALRARLAARASGALRARLAARASGALGIGVAFGATVRWGSAAGSRASVGGEDERPGPGRAAAARASGSGRGERQRPGRGQRPRTKQGRTHSCTAGSVGTHVGTANGTQRDGADYDGIMQSATT